MVSYIQWYHQEFDDNSKYFIHYFTFCLHTLLLGTSTLLRTGASTGNPYSFVIKVSIDDSSLKSFTKILRLITLNVFLACKILFLLLWKRVGTIISVFRDLLNKLGLSCDKLL